MDVDTRGPPMSDGYGEPYHSPQNGSKLSKAAAARAAAESASGKRRIRNGACTFCREKKVSFYSLGTPNDV